MTQEDRAVVLKAQLVMKVLCREMAIFQDVFARIRCVLVSISTAAINMV